MIPLPTDISSGARSYSFLIFLSLFPVLHVSPFCCADLGSLIFPLDFHFSAFFKGIPVPSADFISPALLRLTHTHSPPTHTASRERVVALSSSAEEESHVCMGEESLMPLYGSFIKLSSILPSRDLSKLAWPSMPQLVNVQDLF